MIDIIEILPGNHLKSLNFYWRIKILKAKKFGILYEIILFKQQYHIT